MRTYSIVCNNVNDIEEVVEQHHLTAENNVLIQIFTDYIETQFLKVVVKRLKEKIPHATMLETLPGNKLQNKTSATNSVVITFTVFTEPELKSAILSIPETKGKQALLALSESMHKSLKEIEDYFEKKAEEKAAYLAYFDSATGLSNRLHFTKQVNDFVEKMSKKKKNNKLSIFFIDLDRFKIINDTVRHYAGDIILKEVANRIEELLSNNSFLARFSGDKFTILVTDDVEVERIADLGQKILHVISKPIMYEAREFFLTGSIGASLFPDDGMTTELLFKHADTAMNLAKKQGGNKMKFYSTEMNQQVLYQLELEGYLRRALEKC